MGEDHDPLKCESCGAPLTIRPRDIRRGTVKCGFCNTINPLNLDEKLKDVPGWAATLIKSVASTIPDDEVDDNEDIPVHRPEGSKIEVESMPGYQFKAKIPAKGLSGGSAFLIFFTLFWCGFMVMWNAIGISQGQWMMVSFGLIHDAVGLFLIYITLWGIFGKEELYAEGETFTLTKRLLGIPRRKRIPTVEIDDVTITSKSSRNRKPVKGLYLVVGTKEVRIASNAGLEEIKWLRGQLLEFFKPRW